MTNKHVNPLMVAHEYLIARGIATGNQSRALLTIRRVQLNRAEVAVATAHLERWDNKLASDFYNYFRWW